MCVKMTIHEQPLLLYKVIAQHSCLMQLWLLSWLATDTNHGDNIVIDLVVSTWYTKAQVLYIRPL